MLKNEVFFFINHTVVTFSEHTHTSRNRIKGHSGSRSAPTNNQHIVLFAALQHLNLFRARRKLSLNSWCSDCCRLHLQYKSFHIFVCRAACSVYIRYKRICPFFTLKDDSLCFIAHTARAAPDAMPRLLMPTLRNLEAMFAFRLWVVRLIDYLN